MQALVGAGAGTRGKALPTLQSLSMRKSPLLRHYTSQGMVCKCFISYSKPGNPKEIPKHEPPFNL
jgi:hypothetical protein